jgi:hypothetical protein
MMQVDAFIQKVNGITTQILHGYGRVEVEFGDNLEKYI